jgi:hypothetical protein
MQQQYGGSFPGPHAVNGDALVGCYIESLESAHESVFRHGVTLPMYSLRIHEQALHAASIEGSFPAGNDDGRDPISDQVGRAHFCDAGNHLPTGNAGK